jgi:hypothetical protein
MSLFDLFRLVPRLPYYLRNDRSRRFCQLRGLSHGYICLDGTAYFQCPSNPIAYSVFQDMAFSSEAIGNLRNFLIYSPAVAVLWMSVPLVVSFLSCSRS